MKSRSVIFLAALLCVLHTQNSPAASKNLLYSLQLLSSKNPVKAEGIKNTLQVAGYQSWVKASNKDQLAVYQVRVGRLYSRSAALQLCRRLADEYPAYPFIRKCFVKQVQH